jgi:hypothetical protein
MDRRAIVDELPMWLQPDQLTEFLTGLRLSGYRLGVEEFIVIQGLVLALLGKGETFDDAARLANVLGPIVCKSQAEQADFHKRFVDWCSTAPRPRPTPQRLDSSIRSGFDNDLRNIGTQRQLWRRVAIAVAIMAVGLAIWFLTRSV